MIYNESMCNIYASYMKIKKSKTRPAKEASVRDIVREEMRKSIVREKQMMNSESIREYHKYFKTAKQKFMLDLVKPSINAVFKQSLAQGITSQVIRSLMNKF